MQNYDAKTIPAPLESCINEIYAKFWSRNIQQGITNDLLHSGFQHQLVVLYHFVWRRSYRATTFFSDRFSPQYQENGPHGETRILGRKWAAGQSGRRGNYPVKQALKRGVNQHLRTFCVATVDFGLGFTCTIGFKADSQNSRTFETFLA